MPAASTPGLVRFGVNGAAGVCCTGRVVPFGYCDEKSIPELSQAVKPGNTEVLRSLLHPATISAEHMQTGRQGMESFLAGLEGRSWLAIVLVIGLGILLIGEFSVLASFPGGKRWLGSWMGKVVVFLFYMLLYAPSFAAFGFWSSQTLEPELLVPPASSSDYFLNGLLFGVSMCVVIPAIAIFGATNQFTKKPLAQPSAAPTFRWSTLFWYPLAGLALGLVLGFLFGKLLSDVGLLTEKLVGNLLTNPSATAADASIPVLQRPLVLSCWGAGGSVGLVAGLLVPFYQWLRWWRNSWIRKPFPS